MAKAILGDRVGRLAKLRPISTGVIFDDSKTKVLLTRRSDNKRWCLPGGGIDPGENAEEGCVREIFEETSLITSVERLIGIYTSPNLVIEYPDGNLIQPIVFSFEAIVISGSLSTTEETIAFGYFNKDQMVDLDILEFGREEICDAFQHQYAAFIK